MNKNLYDMVKIRIYFFFFWNHLKMGENHLTKKKVLARPFFVQDRQIAKNL